MENKRNIRKIPFLFLLMLVSWLPAWAQQGVPVEGVILDGNGETVIGASIVVKGEKNLGTISDLDGRFQLTVPNEKSVLVISYIGMKTQEVKVKPHGTMTITLERLGSVGRGSGGRLWPAEKGKCGRFYHPNHRQST